MRKLARAVALGVVMVVLSATAALAAPGTITTPASTPFNVPGNLAGLPQSFTVQATGFATNANVKLEICDGLPASDPQWDVTQDCDLGTQTAGQSSPGTGSTITFTAGDVNFGIKPFNRQSTGASLNGKSPQSLFTCLSVADWPAGSNGTNDGVTNLPAWDNCQIRVASSPTDQAFSTMLLPDPSTAGCGGGEFPATFGSQSGLKVDCNSDPGDNVGRLVIHDATNVDWHHGTARTFTMTGSIVSGASTTTPVSTINFTGAQITAADVGRPISAYNASNNEVFPGGLFIKSAPVGTTVSVSQSFTSNVTGPVTATIEYSRDRWLTDAFCHSINPGNVIVRDLDTIAPGPAMTPTGAFATNTFAADVGAMTVTPVTVQIPSKGTITVLGNDALQHTLHYTAFDGTTFTIDSTSGGGAKPAGAGSVAWKSSTVTEFGSGGKLFKVLAPKLPTVNVGNPGNVTVEIDNNPLTTQVFTYTGSTNAPNNQVTGLSNPVSTHVIFPGSTFNWTSAKALAISTLTLAPSNTNNGVQAASAFTSPAVLEDSAGVADGTISWTGLSGNTFTGVTITGTGVTAGATVKQGYRIAEGSTPETKLSSASAGFTSADLGKSVTGGPFGPGVYISALIGTAPTTQVTLTTVDGSPPIPADCTKNNGGNLTSPHIVVPQDSSSAGTDAVEIGAATFNTGGVHEPKLFPGADPMSVELNNNTAASGGIGFTCSTSDLTLSAAAVNNYGGFTGGEVGLPISVTDINGTTATGVINSTTGNNVAHMSVSCPAAGVTPDATHIASAYIGGPSAGGPPSGSAMMTLAAELNLNPALVPNQNDCQPAGDPAKATFEGFEVVGSWTPPGPGYSANTSAPIVTTAQVLFPTSVLTFNGFVVPQKSGADGAFGTKAHYNFEYPVLPTSLAVCLNDTPANGGVPAEPMQVAFGMNATSLSKAPFLPIGSGNAGDPSVRALLPVATAFAAAHSSIFGSAFHQTVELKTPTGTAIGGSPFTGANCTITDPTVLAALDLTTCGDG